MKKFLLMGLTLGVLNSRADAAPMFSRPEVPDFAEIRREALKAGNIPAPPASPAAPTADDVAPRLPRHMPRHVGKWMLDKSGEIARWMGDRYDNKAMREPINVIVQVDSEEPIQRLVSAMHAAGFKPEWGHSDGYQAILDDQEVPVRIPQLKARPEPLYAAFSDHDFLQPNNHLRLFGPVRFGSGSYFIGAISRENVKIFLDKKLKLKLEHPYASFKTARDAFAEQMAGPGGATLAGYIPLDNAIPADDPFLTTGDHDGRAVALKLQ